MFAKRYLVVFMVLSLLVLLVPAYGVASAKTAKPQDQVKNFVAAAAGLKASKATAYCVTEERSNVTTALAKVPSGTKISVSGLKLAVADQTADTAKVTASYIIKVQLKGQKKAKQSNLSDTFNLKLVNGTWLISDTTMLDHLTGLVATSTPTATPTATSTAAAATTATPSPTRSGNPVKLGAVCSWSGAMAVSGLLADSVIRLVEWQVKQQGGILGGRDVKVVKYDDAGSVANAAAGAQKLIDADGVSALVFGGTYTSEIAAVAGVAEERKVLFATYGAISDLEQKKCTVCVIVGRYAWDDAWVLLAKTLDAKTVAWLGMDDADVRDRMEYGKKKMAAAGTETVYEQYASADTQDFTPYLTKIKYVAPDILCVDEASEGYLSIGKQILELGGLGNTKLLAMTQATTAVTKTKGFEGQYVLVSWLPGLNNPGAIKFEQDYKTLIGSAPNLNHIYYYLSLWTAISAIKLAGTDTDKAKIAEVARSGNLEWDAPVGHIRFNTEGMSDQALTATHVEGGKLVPVTLPK